MDRVVPPLPVIVTACSSEAVADTVLPLPLSVNWSPGVSNVVTSLLP